MEKMVKHLEMVQAVIQRLSTNSFMLKGWSVILVSAILALVGDGSKTRLIILAYLPAIAFWALDGYYIHQERLYRKLYDAVREESEDAIGFSMDASPFASQAASLPRTFFSMTLCFFHGAILLTITLAWIIPVLERLLFQPGKP